MLGVFVLFSGQAREPKTADEAILIASAQTIAIAAVTFREGDVEGFTRARSNFTVEGWTDFIRHMAGFLDQSGAPTFTSSFVPLHDATFLGEKEGVLRLRIPGTLIQSNKLGRTTYRAALQVDAIRDHASSAAAIKIQRLEQITCVGQSIACQ